MGKYTENNKRIAKNTVMLYIRMLLIMIVSLYTTRVVLNVLGANDYGIYNLVGGVVGLMGMVTSLLSQGTSRFITIALGKNDREELRNTFSASMSIHFALAIFILFIGEIIGPWVINGLNIESNRMEAAHFVFQLSLLSSIIGVIQIPYHAVIVAHERMSVYAFISIIDVVAKLLIVYLLLVIDVDKLKLFSVLYFIVGGLTALFYYLYCKRNFKETCSYVFRIDWDLYKAIFKYTGWNAIGACAFTMNGQGITVLLSTFGTSVNAARGIANGITGMIYKFVDSFQIAARPQIFKLCALQDYLGMNALIKRVSKFSSYLLGLVGIPLFIEMDYVLQLWLKDVPDYTVIFARFTLFQCFIQAIDIPLGMGIHAVGKMKLPNLTSAIIYMMILPISYCVIKMGTLPEIVYLVVVCIYPLSLAMDLYIICKFTGFECFSFLKTVCKTCLFVVITIGLLKICICNIMEQGFVRLLCTILVSSFIFIGLIFMYGLTFNERCYLRKIIHRKMSFIHE